MELASVIQTLLFLLCSLRPVDVEFMKALHEKVNIIPLVSKADCLTPNEVKKLKDRVSAHYLIVSQQFLKCAPDGSSYFILGQTHQIQAGCFLHICRLCSVIVVFIVCTCCPAGAR